MNYFAKNIRYLRKKYNMSQNELAERLNYKSFTTIQKWETNDSEPTLSTLSKISKIFNINLSTLCETDLENEVILKKNKSEQQLLKNYNSTNEKGKKRIMTTSEEMVELYPIINRDEILNFFSDNDMQAAALSGKNLNDMSDEELHSLYRLLKDE
ncbi:helix-turn-helix domain-containing protein [Helcococcus kunzii]|uniref:helix-turn-helix domain-containing protein n=1 Tax=Helcococcus kunzii TaxID=40091 RepID=UPI0038ABB4A6